MKTTDSSAIGSFGGMPRYFPHDKTISQVFEDQVELTPEEIALIYQGESYTYYTLNKISDQLAHYLRVVENVQIGSLVAISLDKKKDILVAILAILKLGAVYVPLDPNLPEDRVLYILKETGASLVLENKVSSWEFSNEVFVKRLAWETLYPKLSSFQNLKLDLNVLNPSHLAYILYTSGSSGKPKGVMVEHRGVVNLAKACAPLFGVEENKGKQSKVEQFLWYSNFVFDAHVWEIFTCLLNGHTLHIIDNDVRLDNRLLQEYIREKSITIALLPPAIIDKNIVFDLKTLILGGESSSAEHLVPYKNTEVKVMNAYGLTEATVISTVHPQFSAETVHCIGKPLFNTRAYILDDHLNRVPCGEVGELYLSGVGIARGYLNNDALNQKVFLINPFQTDLDKLDKRYDSSGSYAKLFKTGDLVQALPNGAFIYKGRSDSQIKMRGYRIEPQEIEAVLNGYPGILKSVVTLKKPFKGNSEHKYLVGYYIAENETVKEEELLYYLSSKLPDYMIPHHLIPLSSFPMNLSGKIDHSALPIPILNRSEQFIEPRNAIEKEVRKAWAEILRLSEEMIGIGDDFFALGGNSILAVRLAFRLSSVLKMAISSKAIFAYRTIERIVQESHQVVEEPAVISQSSFNTPYDQFLSFGQERLYFIHQFEGAARAYNIPLFFKIRLTDFNLEAFKASIKTIVQRHEVLRTRIGHGQDGNLYQWVSQDFESVAALKEMCVNSEEDLAGIFDKEASYAFDFIHEDPLRIMLCRLANGECYVSFCIHHMFFDGWSVDLFFKELDHLYRHYTEQVPLSLPDLSVQYRNFAVWQRSYLTEAIVKEQSQYWKKVLNDCQVLRLVPDKARPRQFSYKGRDTQFCIDAELSESLRHLARKLRVSLHAVLLSGYCLMLRAYANQDDIVIGMPVANRHYKGSEDLLGFFVNTLPFRVIIQSNDSVSDYILSVSKRMIDLQAHQDIPLEKIITELNLPKDPSLHPLFQVLFTVQSFGGEDLCPWLEQYQPQLRTSSTAKFDLSTYIDDRGLQIKGIFNHASDIFEESTIKHYLKTYLLILRQFGEMLRKTDELTIADMNFLAPDEYKKIVHDWNDTKCDIEWNKTVHELFEEQVAKTPDSIAVVYEDKQLTYRELNVEANRLAHYLLSKGVVSETLIPIACERSLDMIIGIMGILKAGGAYVPLDPTYPKERLDYILGDVKASLLLKQSWLMGQLPQFSGTTIDLDHLKNSLEDYSSEDPIHRTEPNHLAYVIYTSGSTGRPKGVLSLHKGCVNRLLWMKQYCGISSSDCFLQKTSYAFDVSVWELLMPLISGGCLVFAKPEGHKDPNYLVELINHSQISVIHFVPSMLQGFLSQGECRCPTLKHIICSGEALSADLANLCKEKLPQAELYNFYGPTEASIEVSHYKIAHRQHGYMVPIGKPIWNTSLYILDSNLQPVPIGAIGELYIGGVGLAGGYLNLPELTKERFIDNPFLANEDKLKKNCNTRLYRTGDLCRYHEDSNIEYLCRLDDQVKIHGYRIELGEVEAILLSHPAIQQGAVVVWEDNNGNKRLIAYYLPHRGASITAKGLRDYLNFKLPAYMVPSLLILLTSIPLTSSGKLNRKALPKPDFVDASDNHVSPTTQVEVVLRQLWSDVLAIPVSQISIDKNFFDLGGNSILVLKLKSKVEQVFGSKIVGIVDLFKYPTIQAFSNFLSTCHSGKSINPVPENKRTIGQADIAVIAMSGAFSGVKDLSQFWSHLLNGQESVTRLSKEGCAALNVSKEKIAHENYLGVGGLVEDIEKFDPEFWGLSINDAAFMDPQIRKFLEHSYHALEYGGYISKRNVARIGVFAGMNQSQYYRLNNESKLLSQLSEWEKRNMTDPFQLATRVSYLLGLTGISLTMNTACSTSLATIIEACKNLVLGICDLALAGGVSLTLFEDFGDIVQEGMIFSPDGCCRVFDKNANGTVRGSGVGVVLLKRLQEAEEDKDHILAVIKGYNINNDGNRKIGYAAPSPEGQKECISRAIQHAGVSPESIQYFECHGTGTSIGDAIELSALKEVLVKSQAHASSSRHFLGSVKANIGHTDTAAGVAGFIKVCKMLETKTIPPQINYRIPNEHLSFECLQIATEKRKWDTMLGLPRRAGVSSFGIGGTNAHVILEEYNSFYPPQNEDNKEPLCMIPISAKSKESYQRYCLALHDFIDHFPEISLSDIASTLQHYREEFHFRNLFICSSKAQLQELLREGMPPFEVHQVDPTNLYCDKVCFDSLADLRASFEMISKSWCSGVKVHWSMMYNMQSTKRACALLPGYSFQQLKVWLDRQENEENAIIAQVNAGEISKNKKDEIEDKVIQSFSEVLGCSQLDKQSNFFELGGDSLSALRLARKLSEMFGMKISAALVLKYDSIDKFTEYWKTAFVNNASAPSIISNGEL